MDNLKYVACALPGCQCPVLEVEDQIIYITDDHGMVVQMSYEEFEMIAVHFLNHTGVYKIGKY